MAANTDALQFPTGIINFPHITFVSRKYEPVSIINPQVGRDTTQTDAATVKNVKGEPDGNVVLYIPASFADAIGSSWGSESLGFGSQEALSMVKSVRAGNYMEAGGTALKGIGTSLVGAFAKAPGGKQIATAIAYNTGRGIVPNAVLTLESANHYELSLNYELNPNNQEEANTIKKITQFFKRASTPGIGTLGPIATLDYPPLFDIYVQTKDPTLKPDQPARRYSSEEGLAVYTNMVLTNYSAAYGGSATTAMFYPDGNNISIQMQLTFKSLRPGYREGVNI